MRSLLYAVCATALLGTFNANGQVYQDFVNASETKNFEEIVSAVESYYADKEKGRGSG